MALQIATVADSISKLSVAGATLKDIDELPKKGTVRNTPVIIPKPNGFLSNFKPERDSFGPGTTAKITVTYTLTYRLLHSEIGTGRTGIFSTYAAMVAITSLFLDAIIANDTVTGAVDLEAADVTEFGPVADPMGKMFHGCDIAINIMEYVN